MGNPPRQWRVASTTDGSTAHLDDQRRAAPQEHHARRQGRVRMTSRYFVACLSPIEPPPTNDEVDMDDLRHHVPAAGDISVAELDAAEARLRRMLDRSRHDSLRAISDPPPPKLRELLKDATPAARALLRAAAPRAHHRREYAVLARSACRHRHAVECRRAGEGRITPTRSQPPPPTGATPDTFQGVAVRSATWAKSSPPPSWRLHPTTPRQTVRSGVTPTPFRLTFRPSFGRQNS